ncbi:hypothetical protein [Endozoicomonas sp. SESOKO1]|uniref:hypothetical protein n=1 Tax=Endozoicomonas sp. SESOKO1 TaxID=2828742 RepID=UPI0035A0F86E
MAYSRVSSHDQRKDLERLLEILSLHGAWLAVLVEQELGHNPDIQAQYQRLLANGKTKMQAIGAAMPKLVQICFGVVKHQSEYQPQSA